MAVTMNDKDPSVHARITSQAVVDSTYVGNIAVGAEVKLTGAADYEVTDDLAAGEKAVGEVFSLNRTDGSAESIISVLWYFRAIKAKTSGDAITAGNDVVFDASEKVIPQVKTFTAATSPRTSRANVALAGLVTTGGDGRVTIGGNNVDTALLAGMDPEQAAKMICDAINRDATVGPLVHAWWAMASSADGGVARGNIALAGTVTTGGTLRGTLGTTNIDVALTAGDTPFEAAEMWCDALNAHADLGDDFFAFPTSADADALEGARAFGAVEFAVNGTGGATATITLDGTAVQLVPGAGEQPDDFANRMADACNENANINDRFMFTVDEQTPGAGGAANVRIWAKHPGSVYNVTLVAASTDATMTATASGAALTGGADITEATIYIRALKSGAAYNVALAASQEAGLVGLTPTASGAALTEGSDDAAATVFLESRYFGAIANSLTLAASQQAGLVGLTLTASGATFLGGADDTKHDPLAVHGVALNAATGADETVYVGIY